MFYKRRKYAPNKNIFTEIFEKIYSKLECNIIYVFLCGGACEKGSNQIRDDIKILLEKKSNNKIRILYPEKLFFKKDGTQLTEFFKNEDLLKLETILAHNSDIVCIICESMGSATELGAFTNYKQLEENGLLDKLVAVTYQKYEDKPSFISEGPIKRIKKKDKNKFKLYELKKYTRKKNIPEIQQKLVDQLITEFNKICKKNSTSNDYNRIYLKKSTPINNFIGLSYLIILLVYFYKEINSKALITMLKKELSNLDIINIEHDPNFDNYLKMSKRYLFDIQSYLVENKKNKNETFYKLTTNGLNFIKNNILNLEKINLKDVEYIRFKLLGRQLYKYKL